MPATSQSVRSITFIPAQEAKEAAVQSSTPRRFTSAGESNQDSTKERLRIDCVCNPPGRRQTGAVLAKLRKDIRALETELALLKHDEDLWGRLAGSGSAGGGVAGAPRAAGRVVVRAAELIGATC